MKKTIIATMMLLSVVTALQAEDSIWNRLFFLDFQYLGEAVIADPLKTGLIAGGFGAATYLLMKNDLWLSRTVISNRNDFNDAFFNIFNYAGDAVMVLAADSLLFALGGEKEKKVAVKVVEGLAVSGAINYVSKVSFGRERPSSTDDPMSFKWFDFSDNSYPSGHTVVVFTCATIIADAYDIGWITYPVAALTGLARVYRKAHWPSDILFGAMIGVITGKIVGYEGHDLKLSAVPGGIDISCKF